jgi:hypothetical protein
MYRGRTERRCIRDYVFSSVVLLRELLNEFMVEREYKYDKGWTLEGSGRTFFSSGEEWLVIVCCLDLSSSWGSGPNSHNLANFGEVAILAF